MSTIKELIDLRDEQIKEKEWALKQIQDQLASGVGELNPIVQSLYRMIEKCNERIDKYHRMMDELGKTGRPSIGITKKVSITLPAEVWEFLDQVVETSDSNRSAVLRDILINAYEGDIEWFRQVFSKTQTRER